MWLFHQGSDQMKNSSINIKFMEQIGTVTAASWWFTNISVHPSSIPASTKPETIHIIIPPYVFTITLMGLLLNCFVLAVFFSHKDRLTVAEIYLSNLALADFLLLSGLPFWAMYILNNFNWTYGDTLCKLVNSMIIINFYTSIYTLVMISIDRYLALVKTMKARWLRRSLYAKVMCIILWLMGFLLSVPTIVHRKVNYIEAYETTSCVLDYAHGSPWKLAHQIMLNVLGFALPVLVIVFSSWKIIRSLDRRTESLAFRDPHDTKAIVLLYAVTLLFLLCWGPFQVFTLLDTLCDVKVLDENRWNRTLEVGGEVSVYLAFLNSTLNPLLYVFSGQYFRKKVTAIYRRTVRQRRGSDITMYQRSVYSTYVNRTEVIKPVVISNVSDQRDIKNI